ncbi:MAG: DUF763 domain-containing protein [Thermoprotei archaeon]
MFEGVAELPLHDGTVPPWLARIMKRLAHAILSIMVEEYGPGKVVERLANPLWFQAFNNVIGMDWDSSGSTTVTTGILKTVTWKNPELGILVLGGKGSNARRVPEEAPKAVDILGMRNLSPEDITRVSRLIARIDSYMLQDGYTLYHHTVILSSDGKWAVIQQGMNPDNKMARRYHWLYRTTYYEDPHEAVSGIKHNTILNLVARESRRTRKTILDLVREKPDRVISDYSRIYRELKGVKTLFEQTTQTKTGVIGLTREKLLVYKPLPLPSELLVRLRELYRLEPDTLDDLVLGKPVNDKVLRALALISDLIYNEPPSTIDPVNTPYDPFIYAYAIGGKDGVPYPVDRRVAEEVILTLEDFVYRARLGDKERLRALRNLARLKKLLEIPIRHRII